VSGQLATRAGHRQDIGGRSDGQTATQTGQVTALEHAHQQPAGRGDQLTSGPARTAQGHSHHRTLTGPTHTHPISPTGVDENFRGFTDFIFLDNNTMLL